MSKIAENLQKILSAHYGKDVRQAIHDSIKDCYEDGKSGATDLTARTLISNLSSKVAQALAGINELYWKPGDYLQTSGTNIIICDGFISNSSRTLYFTIPLSKPIRSDVNNVNIDFSKASIRCQSGYIDGLSSLTSLPSGVTCNYYVHNGMLSITLVSSTAFKQADGTTVPNNTLVSMYLSGSRISFN